MDGEDVFGLIALAVGTGVTIFNFYRTKIKRDAEEVLARLKFIIGFEMIAIGVILLIR